MGWGSPNRGLGGVGRLYQGKEWCRVSIGLQEEMKMFVEVFSKEFA